MQSADKLHGLQRWKRFSEVQVRLRCMETRGREWCLQRRIASALRLWTTYTRHRRKDRKLSDRADNHRRFRILTSVVSRWGKHTQRAILANTHMLAMVGKKEQSVCRSSFTAWVRYVALKRRQLQALHNWRHSMLCHCLRRWSEFTTIRMRIRQTLTHAQARWRNVKVRKVRSK